MNFIEVTHANTGGKALIVKEKIFAISYSDVQKCLIIYADGGAAFPVSESEDYVKAQLRVKVESDFRL